MKRAICLILALVFCLSLSCTVFATGGDTDDSFLSSPGESGTPDVTTPGVDDDNIQIPTDPSVDNDDTNVPDTGDGTPVELWIGLMVVAAAALVVVILVFRKKFSDR